MRARTLADLESGPSKFFRARLLRLDRDEISQYLDSMDREAHDIRQENLRLTWYMRGGINYEQVMQLSSQERQMISQIAKDNIETTKKTKLPWF